MALIRRVLLSAVFATSALGSNFPARVSENGRYLETGAGEPFFWLADTAWELFHRLDREQATAYLEQRAAQGFNVVTAVILAELDGLRAPNAYGAVPLEDLDPERPNEAYFEHVDFVVAKANELGMTVGLLPTWGDKFNLRWGVGPEIFTPANAFAYGRFVGERYSDASVVWILGGDRSPDEEEDFAIVHAMARGIREGDGKRRLMTYHPQGHRSSSRYFHDADWLDFNLHQSGHGSRDFPNYNVTRRDYALTPVKPTLDGEPCYEDHPVNWKLELGRFDDFESRRAGYWSVLSGAMGHAYGHNSVWQMWEPGREPVSNADVSWREALEFPGAYQAGHMRKALESVAWHQLAPASELIAGGPRDGPNAVRIAASPDRALLLAYAPYGDEFSIQLPGLDASEAAARWFNPRDGASTHFEAQAGSGTNVLDFDPPLDPERGNDWLLVLERR